MLIIIKLINDKFKSKYRTSSLRLQNYDYRNNGIYYITICTHKKKSLFGDIVNNKMQYSAIGKIAHKCWLEIPEHFPFVYLDDWVIMPNHLHGILSFKKDNNIGFDLVKLQSQSLASIIRGFKIGVTKYARLNTNISNVWQARFYDHIIMTEDSLSNIRQYIKNNPLIWSQDKYNTNSCRDG